MSSTVRFFDGNAIYGCSGLGNCRMLIFLSGAFFLIGLIIRLIRWNHSITHIFRVKLPRDFVVVSIPTFTTVLISNKILKNSHRPPWIENQHGRHIYDEVNRKIAITFPFFKIETWFKCPSPYFWQQYFHLVCVLLPSSNLNTRYPTWPPYALR